jgi:hypothetical protein
MARISVIPTPAGRRDPIVPIGSRIGGLRTVRTYGLAQRQIVRVSEYFEIVKQPSYDIN